MAETSPLPWRTGNHVGRTIYRQDPDAPRGVLIGVMDTVDDAALAVAAVNAYGEPDLREGRQQSERRRRIAALVADHHRDCLSGHSPSVPVDAVIDAMTAVIAALGGATDPYRLGLVERPDVYTRVSGVIASTSAEANRG